MPLHVKKCGLLTIPRQIHIGSGKPKKNFVQLRQDNLNLAILEVGRPKVEEGSAIVLALHLWRRSQDPTFTMETLGIFMIGSSEHV